MQKTLLTVAMAVCAFAALAQETRVYRWVDSNNVVHFSHNHPTDRDYAQVDVKVSYKPTDKPDDATSTLSTENTEDSTQANEQENLDISKQSAAVIKQNCESAKVNLKILSGFEKILYKDPQGEERVLTPEEKQEQLTLSQKHFDAYCNAKNAEK